MKEAMTKHQANVILNARVPGGKLLVAGRIQTPRSTASPTNLAPTIQRLARAVATAAGQANVSGRSAAIYPGTVKR